MFWEKKWEEEKEKREGTTGKMTKRFEGILINKEETCINHNKIKEGKRRKGITSSWRRWKWKINIEEKNIETKLLALKMADLDPYAMVIVKASRMRMLKCMPAAQAEDEAEAEAMAKWTWRWHEHLADPRGQFFFQNNRVKTVVITFTIVPVKSMNIHFFCDGALIYSHCYSF